MDEMIKNKIGEKLAMLPDRPGVYLMRDENGTVIYVGKAKVLKNRVRQYFQNSKNHSLKIQRMISKIEDFEYVITDTEMEALILEASFIKKHWPRYNTLLKDDKQYPYIKVVKEAYPRIIKVRQIQRDRAKYFGPYTSGFAVNQILEVIHELYPLRKCNLKLTGEKVIQRPCLNYYIHKCKAPCQGYISEEEYHQFLEEAIKIVEGKYRQLEKRLEEEMLLASKELRFEDAAKYRDRIESLKILSVDQKVASVKEQDYDIIGIAQYLKDACVQIFFVRGGRILGKEHFILEDVEEEKLEKLSADFIQQFYGENTFVPRIIYVQEELEERELFESWLQGNRGMKVEIQVPKRGEKYQLLQMVKKNAFDQVFKHGEDSKRKNQKTVFAVRKLQEILGISGTVHRMESYDISSTQGQEQVAAMVVFLEGIKQPSEYRKFKMKTVQGPDDYASMREVILRRFSHGLEDKEKQIQGGFAKFPELLLIDGGKGQVMVVEEALEILKIQIPVCGMVKDHRHRTRGLIYQGREYSLKEYPDVFKLITEIQDETHRFAITYHRLLRSNKIFRSELDQIEGIGEKRKKALLQTFGDVETIRNTQVEVLCQVKGMNRKIAEQVYSYFHPINSEEES